MLIRNISIKNKIIAIILFVSILIVISVFTFVTISYRNSIKTSIINNIKVNARLIAEYCTKSLSFKYPERATTILSKLKSIPQIINAQIYDDGGNLFAFYAKENKIAQLPDFNNLSNHFLKGDYLHVCEPIIYEGHNYGNLYIKADTNLSIKISNHISVLSIFIIILIIIVYILAFNLQKIISNPILKLTQFTEDFSKTGDYSMRIHKDSNDETGLLYNAFNEMIDAIQSRNNEIKKQSWIKTGQAELSEKIRGDLNINILGKAVITFIAKYLNAQTGLIYMINDKDTLSYIGSYACKLKNIEDIKPGQGLIGESLLKKKIINISNCPKNYISYDIGMGDINLSNILIFPFLLNNSVNSIIEIASFNKFTDEAISFLQQISESIAISINSSDSRSKLSNLLEQTQNLAKEIMIREEELKVTNEELESKNKVLIEQKIDIENKNKELESAHYELAKKARELELSNQYKSEFLANMSHELRTPLNSILLLSKVMIANKTKNLTDNDIESLETINYSGTELLNLINDILDLSKVEAGKMELYIEKILIDDIIVKMKRSFKALAEDKKIDYTIEKQTNVPKYIYSDSQRIEQILKNFLSNAFKFTSQGSVSLIISKPDLDENVEIDLIENGINIKNVVAFSVIDTGIGIPEQKQKLIFEAFRQVDGSINRRFGGTGLGLSISLKFAELLNGFIRLESEENKGSIFTLYIPEKNKKVNEENCIQ